MKEGQFRSLGAFTKHVLKRIATTLPQMSTRNQMFSTFNFIGKWKQWYHVLRDRKGLGPYDWRTAPNRPFCTAFWCW